MKQLDVARDSNIGRTSLWPMSYASFWDSISRKGGEGIRLTFLRHPHTCGMCTTLPMYQSQLEETRVALKNRHISSDEKTRLGNVMTNLETLISRRLMHVEVLSHQRRWINYNIRDV